MWVMEQVGDFNRISIESLGINGTENWKKKKKKQRENCIFMNPKNSLFGYGYEKNDNNRFQLSWK